VVVIEQAFLEVDARGARASSGSSGRDRRDGDAPRGTIAPQTSRARPLTSTRLRSKDPSPKDVLTLI